MCDSLYVINQSYYRVFTLKPVPNWINWNRFTELGFDDLLAFTPVIWNWFRLHALVSDCDDMDPFLVVCALLLVKIMLFRRAKNCKRRIRQCRTKRARKRIRRYIRQNIYVLNG